MVLEMTPEQQSADIGAMQLDDILEMREPQKTRYLREWLNFIDEKHMGQVLVKASKGSTFPATYRGRVVKVPPRGVRIDRRIAVDLLVNYGKHGIYVGMDPATGMTPSRWKSMKKDERELYVDAHGSEPSFIDRYLTHIPDNPQDLQEPDFPEFPDTDEEDTDEE